MKAVYLFFALIVFVSCSKESDVVDSPCAGELLVHDNDLFRNGPEDPSTVINDFSFDAPCLTLNLSYGGGCQDHNIELVLVTNLDSPIDGGPLQKLHSKIIHNNTDLCEAYITEDRIYDLSKVLELYDQRTYTLLIFVNDHVHSLTIDF